jgi:hypothetical protein
VHARELTAGKEHAFKVRLASVFGFPGLFSDTQIAREISDKLTGDDSSIGGMSRTVLLAIALPCAAVLVALVVLLGVYCVRHRRLQRSFASYASSHYDRRANSATLNDLDDEDQPMIRCFADDEPLLVG